MVLAHIKAMDSATGHVMLAIHSSFTCYVQQDLNSYLQIGMSSRIYSVQWFWSQQHLYHSTANMPSAELRMHVVTSLRCGMWHV